MFAKKFAVVQFGILVFVVSAFSGCSITTFDHPIVSPTAAKPAPELSGVYFHTEPGEQLVYYVHVGPAGKEFPDGFLRIITIGQPKIPGELQLHSIEQIAWAGKVADHYVFSIPVEKGHDPDKSRATWTGGWDESKIDHFRIARVTKREDEYQLAFTDSNFLVKQVTENHLAGKIVAKKILINGVESKEEIQQVHVTASSEELMAFVTRHIDGGLFNGDGTKFTRLKPPK